MSAKSPSTALLQHRGSSISPDPETASLSSESSVEAYEVIDADGLEDPVEGYGVIVDDRQSVDLHLFVSLMILGKMFI